MFCRAGNEEFNESINVKRALCCNEKIANEARNSSYFWGEKILGENYEELRASCIILSLLIAVLSAFIDSLNFSFSALQNGN